MLLGGRYTGSCWGQVHCIALLLWHTGGDPSFNVKFDSIEDVRHRTALKRIHSDVTHIQTEDLKGRSWYRRECIIPTQLTPRHRNNSHQLLPRITSQPSFEKVLNSRSLANIFAPVLTEQQVVECICWTKLKQAYSQTLEFGISRFKKGNGIKQESVPIMQKTSWTNSSSSLVWSGPDMIFVKKITRPQFLRQRNYGINA